MSLIEHYLRTFKPKATQRTKQATVEELQSFEERFELSIPDDYCEFLLSFGALQVKVTCPLHEPSPLGDAIHINELHGMTHDEHDTQDIRWWTKVVEGKGLTVPVASNSMGGAVYLMCAGTERGRVLFRDPQQRDLWPDERFYKLFPSLDPAIEKWLTLRREGKLTQKKTPHWYLLASSFTEFLSHCKSDSE